MNTPGGANAKIRFYRRIHHAGGIAALARVITEQLDARSGRHKLTPAEHELQESCRARYGLYDPALGYQARYIDTIRTRTTS